MKSIRSTREMQLIQYEMLKELDRICNKYNITYSLAYGTLLGAVRHKGYIPWDTDTDVMINIKEYDILCEKLEQEIDNKFVVHYIRNSKESGSLLRRIGLKNESTKWMHLDLFPIVGAPSTKFKQNMFDFKSKLVRKIYFFKDVNVKENYSQQHTKKIIAMLIKFLCFLIPKQLLFYLNTKMMFKYNIDDADYIYNLYGSYGLREFIPRDFYFDQTKIEFENFQFSAPKNWHGYLTKMYGDYMTPKK